MIHKFFLIGAYLTTIIAIVSIIAYIDNFSKIEGYYHFSSLASIGLNIMWILFFLYLYKQNKPNKANLNDIEKMIDEFNITQEVKK